MTGARAVGLRQRGDHGVHRPGRRVLLPRDEHAAAGGAPGDRGGDRARPGRRPSSGWRPASRCRGAGGDRPARREPSSAGSTRRTRPRASCPRRGGSPARAAARPGRPSRVRGRGGRGGSGTLRPAPRQADRDRRDARRGHRADERGARGVRGRGVEDHDPVPPARDAECRVPGRRASIPRWSSKEPSPERPPADSRDGDDSHRRAHPGDDRIGTLAQRESRRLPRPLGARASGPDRAGGRPRTHHVGGARPVGGPRGRRARPDGVERGSVIRSSSPTGARR